MDGTGQEACLNLSCLKKRIEVDQLYFVCFSLSFKNFYILEISASKKFVENRQNEVCRLQCFKIQKFKQNVQNKR